jgi:photosystem II stability/assembly factor-like uncharacterized protein
MCFPQSPQQPDNDPVYTLASAPGSAIVFAGRASGLYRSPDGGATWRPVLESLGISEPSPVAAVAVSPVFLQDRTVLAGLPGAALRSTDGGAAWQMLPFQPPAPYLTALAFSPDYPNDGVILGGTAEDGILRSANGGDDWTYWNFGLLDLEILCLAVSPAFEQDETIFAGTSSGLFRSTNGGRAWKELQLPCGHVPVLSLSIGDPVGTHPSIFAGTEEHGLFVSENSGKSWSPVGSGGLEGAIHAVFSSGEEKNLCLGVLVDAEMRVSTDQGATWRRVRLPGGQEGISAALPPAGIGLERPLLVGLETGEIVYLEKLSSYL